MSIYFSNLIKDFIKDFSLSSSHGSIMFDSKILFLDNAVPSFYSCKTAIVPVNVKNLYAIYFLNADIAKDGFKDHFTLADNSVSYLKNEGLKITERKSFSVYIFPLATEPAGMEIKPQDAEQKFPEPEPRLIAGEKKEYEEQVLTRSIH
jgi:hypothetical protein